MIALQPAMAFSAANAWPSFWHRAQLRVDCAAAGATIATALAPSSSPAIRVRARTDARTAPLLANALGTTLEGPLRDVALARIEYGIVPFHVIKTFPDRRRHGGAARHVGMERHVEPLRAACFALAIELVERVLEIFQEYAWRVGREHPG